MGKGVWKDQEEEGLGKAWSGVLLAHSGLREYKDGSSTCPYPKDLRWSEEGGRVYACQQAHKTGTIHGGPRRILYLLSPTRSCTGNRMPSELAATGTISSGNSGPSVLPWVAEVFLRTEN